MEFPAVPVDNEFRRDFKQCVAKDLAPSEKYREELFQLLE